MYKRNKQTTFIKKFFSSKFFLVILVLVTGMVAFAYARAYYQDYRVKEEILSLQKEIKKLEQKKIESLEILQYVTSREFLEAKARTELNLKKPGENMVIVTPQKEGSKQQETEKGENKIESNLVKWWNYFFSSK